MISNRNKRLFACAVAFSTLSFSIAGFASCKPSIPSDNTTPSIDPSEETPQTQPKASISFADFMDEYRQEGIDFINENVRSKVVNDKDILAEKWTIAANENDELDSASVSLVYKVDENIRAVDYLNIELQPIDLDDIVEHNAVEVNTTIKTLGSFQFDAKENYEKAELATAIFNAFNLDETTSTLVFREVDTPATNTRGFEVINLNENSATVHSIEVYKGDGSDETMIENLGNYVRIVSKEVIATYNLIGEHLYTNEYTKEEFKTPDINPDKPAIKDLEELLTNHSDILNEALNESCYPTLVNDTLKNGIYRFDETKLSNSQWDFATNDNGEITKINFTSHYQASDVGTRYLVASISLENPLNILQMNEDTIKKIIATATESAEYNLDYSFGYNPNIQNTRNDLIDAIFEANGITKPEGAIRLFTDNNSHIDTTFGTIHEFTVVEISNNSIKEINLKIKESDGDQGYIQNLKNGDFRVNSQKSVELGGTKLDFQTIA